MGSILKNIRHNKEILKLWETLLIIKDNIYWTVDLLCIYIPIIIHNNPARWALNKAIWALFFKVYHFL
jgi:hypothetical protein